MSFQCQALEADQDSELVKGDLENIANWMLLTFHLFGGEKIH